MTKRKCDYCGRAFHTDEHDPDNPPSVFGESKCKYCGEPNKNVSEEQSLSGRKETGCLKG